MSITSTSRFFHVSEVSVFCCLTNSIRPEGCREYMHRSLSLGSGRDGSCGGANILENSQKNLKKWGKYFYSDGSNPHSAGIRTHSQFKKFLQIHSYIRNMIDHLRWRCCVSWSANLVLTLCHAAYTWLSPFT